MRTVLLSLVAAGLLSAGPLDLRAQGALEEGDFPISFGAEVAISDEYDTGVGGRAVMSLDALIEGLDLVGSFIVFFPEPEDVDYWEINANFLYGVLLPERDNFVPYFGGGVNFPTTNELGFNGVGGVRFPVGFVTPFIEARIALDGGDHLSLSAGLVF